MKRFLFTFMASALMTASLSSISVSFADYKQSNQQNRQQVRQIKPSTQQVKAGERLIMADEMEFSSVLPGVAQKALSGSTQGGHFLGITKFAAGTKHALHTHPNDVRIIVIKGQMSYQSNGEEKILGPGSYLSIPGGLPHVSGAVGEEDLYFVQDADQKFELNYIE